MSEAVERRIVAMLTKPLVCPHGNPIPGLEDLGLPFASVDDPLGLITMSVAATAADSTVRIDRISEQLQPDSALMRRIADAGLRPGRSVHAAALPRGGVEVWDQGDRVTFSQVVTDHVFVRNS